MLKQDVDLGQVKKNKFVEITLHNGKTILLDTDKNDVLVDYTRNRLTEVVIVNYPRAGKRTTYLADGIEHITVTDKEGDPHAA